MSDMETSSERLLTPLNLAGAHSVLAPAGEDGVIAGGHRWLAKDQITPALRPRSPDTAPEVNAPDDTNWAGGVLLAPPRFMPAPLTRLASYTTDFDSQQHVVYIGTDRHVHEIFYSNAWHHNDLTVATGAPLAALDSTLTGYATNFNSQQHVVFIADGRRWPCELYYDGSWKLNDFSADLPNLSPARAGSPLVGYATGFNAQQHVVYFGDDGQIFELFYTDHWQESLLSGMPGAIAAGNASALAAYSSEFSSQQHVIYVGADRRLREIYWSGGGWVGADLTGSPSGFAPPRPDTPIAGYATEFNSQHHVIYVDASASRVRELYYDGTWKTTDLSGVPGAQAWLPGSAVVGYATEFDSQQHVVYETSMNRLCELFYAGGWQSNDLLTASGGTFVPAPLTPMAGCASGYDRQQHIIYISPASHICQMFYADGSWHNDDLSLTAISPWTACSGTWNVPAVGPSNRGSGQDNFWRASSWVGIDGSAGSNDVLQAGIEHTVQLDGSSSHLAWIEWFAPKRSGSPSYVDQTYVDNLPVSVGDNIFCRVTYDLAHGQGDLHLGNLTTGGWFEIALDPPPGASFSGNAAEWIVESPTYNGHFTELPRFDPVTFTAAGASDSAGTGGDPKDAGVVEVVRGITAMTQSLVGPGQVKVRYLSWHDVDLTSAAAGSKVPPRRALAAYATEYNAQEHIVAIGDGEVPELYWTDKWRLNRLTRAAGALPAQLDGFLTGYSTEYNSQQHVVYVDSDGELVELYYDANNWKVNRLSIPPISVPKPRTDTPVTGYATGFNGQQHIIYIDRVFGHITEAYEAGSGWQANDLSVVAGSPTSWQPRTGVAGYATEFNGQQHVIYLGQDLRIHELYYIDAWKDNDLTAIAGAPTPRTNSPIAGYSTEFNGQHHVIYVGQDLRIYELYYINGWHWADLSMTPGAAAWAPDTAITGYATNFNQQQHVVYVGVDKRIHELYYSGQWQHNDLTVATNGVPPRGDTPVVGFSSTFNKQEHVVFVGADDDIHQYYY